MNANEKTPADGEEIELTEGDRLDEREEVLGSPPPREPKLEDEEDEDK